ncbi:deoxyribodipyrimidine photo-lyase, partial [Rhizobium johnstonii]
PLGASQAWWLHHSLEALNRSLQKLHGLLVLASGEALEVLRAFIKEIACPVRLRRKQLPALQRFRCRKLRCQPQLRRS